LFLLLLCCCVRSLLAQAFWLKVRSGHIMWRDSLRDTWREHRWQGRSSWESEDYRPWQDKFARDGWQQEWRNGYEKQGWDSRASETREKNCLKDSADWQSYWSPSNGAQSHIASEADHEQSRFTVSAKKRAKKGLADFTEGEVVTGKVTKIMAYGVFVDIGARKDALAPARLLEKAPTCHTKGEELQGLTIKTLSVKENLISVGQKEEGPGGKGAAGRISVDELKVGSLINGPGNWTNTNWCAGQESTKPTTATTTSTQLEKALATLRELGLGGDEVNRELLATYDGDVVRVANILFAVVVESRSRIPCGCC
jgi:hypothetical protein